jgi:hypothetical protein
MSRARHRPRCGPRRRSPSLEDADRKHPAANIDEYAGVPSAERLEKGLEMTPISDVGCPGPCFTERDLSLSTGHAMLREHGNQHVPVREQGKWSDSTCNAECGVDDSRAG